MIVGTHIAISSSDEAADKAFLKDVLKLPFVDAGGGYLIFAGAAAEFAVHESSGSAPEIYLMCRNIQKFTAAMNKNGTACAPLRHAGYGILTEISLPGGARIGVYEPRHKRPKASAKKPARKPAKAIKAKRPAKKSKAKAKTQR
jgi:predicted enzyme related to lactoylglutathione lyase